MKGFRSHNSFGRSSKRWGPRTAALSLLPSQPLRPVP